jgi:hypothetical protein
MVCKFFIRILNIDYWSDVQFSTTCHSIPGQLYPRCRDEPVLHRHDIAVDKNLLLKHENQQHDYISMFAIQHPPMPDLIDLMWHQTTKLRHITVSTFSSLHPAMHRFTNEHCSSRRTCMGIFIVSMYAWHTQTHTHVKTTNITIKLI